MAGPTAAEFFEPQTRPQLSQGDIVLSPSTILWSETARPPLNFGTPAPPQLGGSVTVPVWDDYGVVPLTVAEARWSPVMILSHDCELDKEFNRRVEQLIKEGRTESEAIDIATADESLDPHVVVSPLIPYADVPTELHAAIRDASRIGFIPVPAAPAFDNEEFLVDLSRVSTVERRLINRFGKVASLTDDARGAVQFKIAEAFATRSLSTLDHIEGLIGQRIAGIETYRKTAKATSLVLRLEDGNSIHMEIKAPRASLKEEILRKLKGKD